MRQWVSRILAVLIVVPGLGMVALDQASAGVCRWENVAIGGGGPGAIDYQRRQVDCPAGVTPASATPASGTSGPPPCDVAKSSPATFCWGSRPCYYKASVAPYGPPATPEPTPGAQWQVRMCFMVEPGLSGQPNNSLLGWFGTAVWVGQANPAPPLVDQAREAFGQLVIPTGSLVFNPPGRTLVNFDTWFWAQDLSGAELRGSSAFGLVAIATPGKLVITPGDGSPALSCAWVTAKSDACSYAYQRSSVGGEARSPSGTPAYQATGVATWTVRFENNGAPAIIAGAPTVLTGPKLTAAVVVTEVQTLVTGAT